MVKEKKDNSGIDEGEEVDKDDNDEIIVNTKTILIRELFDGAKSFEEVFEKLDEVELIFEDLYAVYTLTAPIEQGCAHFERRNWIKRGSPGWEEAVEAWNESNEEQIKP